MSVTCRLLNEGSGNNKNKHLREISLFSCVTHTLNDLPNFFIIYLVRKWGQDTSGRILITTY